MEAKKKKSEESDDNIEVKPDKSEEEAQLKQYRKDGHKPAEKVDDDMAAQLQKDVNKISKNIVVLWDDHKDLVVDAKDLFKVRIIRQWENNFNVEAFVKSQDRIKVIGLNWEQVRAFIKTNFITMTKTYVVKAQDKVKTNTEDQTKKPSKDLPKSNAVKEKEVEKKEKEDEVTDKDDLPNADMKQVNDKKIEKQSDHEVDKSVMKKKVSQKKEKDDDTLTTNWKK
jgi:hypothetical protein